MTFRSISSGLPAGLPAGLLAGLLAAILATALPASAASGSGNEADRYLHLRARPEPIQITSVRATDEELVATIRDRGLEREQRFPWDEVAAVDPRPDGTLEAMLPRGLQLGDRIWRGVQRLQRGDARLAATAFREALDLEPKLPGRLAATALEGLVRSMVALRETDGVQGEAAILGDLAAAGLRSDRFTGPLFESDSIDPATGLVVDVPPLADDFDPIELKSRFRPSNSPLFSDDSVLRRDLWDRLLQRAGPPPEVADRNLHEGTRFLLELARLDATDEGVRTTAMRRLRAMLDEAPAWRVAWIRWFLGSSTIRAAGDDVEANLAGVLDLVHVLALEDAAPPAIRLASLRLATETLARIDRSEESAVLEAILRYERPAPAGSENDA